MPSVPNRGYKPTSIRQPTQIAIFFRVFRSSIHRRNPIPLNPCPSVFIRGEKTPRPLPSFRVIRVFRGSNNTPIHPWSSVFIRGSNPTTKPQPHRLRWNFALPQNLTLIPCLPWFQQHPHPSVVIGVHPWFENDHRIKPAQMELRPPQKTAPHSVSSVVPKTPGNCAEDTDFRDFPVRSSSAAAEFFPFRAVPNCENRRVRQGDT